MKKLYGSFQNRVMEDKMFTDEIKVGTGCTEYLYTDRLAYEVIAVKDQKHVTIRKYDHKPIGEGMTNTWELVSNPNNITYELTKRGQYWYKTVVITVEDLEEIENCTDQFKKMQGQLWLAHNEVDPEKLRAKGKITKYHRAHVSFGTADYYYDYEF